MLKPFLSTPGITGGFSCLLGDKYNGANCLLYTYSLLRYFKNFHSGFRYEMMLIIQEIIHKVHPVRKKTDVKKLPKKVSKPI